MTTNMTMLSLVVPMDKYIKMSFPLVHIDIQATGHGLQHICDHAPKYLCLGRKYCDTFLVPSHWSGKGVKFFLFLCGKG